MIFDWITATRLTPRNHCWESLYDVNTRNAPKGALAGRDPKASERGPDHFGEGCPSVTDRANLGLYCLITAATPVRAAVTPRVANSLRYRRFRDSQTLTKDFMV